MVSKGKFRLNPTSHMILGLVALRGPSSPYDLKRAIDQIDGLTIPVSHTQLYGETARLAKGGMLAVEQEEGSRRRQTYSLTEEGWAALEAWLDEPTESPPEIWDAGQFKLFLSEFRSPEDVARLAREQAEAARQRLERLQATRERFGDAKEYQARMLALPLGIVATEAAYEFWSKLAANPPSAAALKGPRSSARARAADSGKGVKPGKDRSRRGRE